MSPEKQNEAVAKAVKFDQWLIVKGGFYYRPNACGYTSCIHDAWKLPKVEAEKHIYPHHEPVTIKPVPTPDYGADLNTMHEALLTLSESDHALYYSHLVRAVGTLKPFAEYFAKATHQREAFLKTIGKWEDTPDAA